MTKEVDVLPGENDGVMSDVEEGCLMDVQL